MNSPEYIELHPFFQTKERPMVEAISNATKSPNHKAEFTMISLFMATGCWRKSGIFPGRTAPKLLHMIPALLNFASTTPCSCRYHQDPQAQIPGTLPVSVRVPVLLGSNVLCGLFTRGCRWVIGRTGVKKCMLIHTFFHPCPSDNPPTPPSTRAQ